MYDCIIVGGGIAGSTAAIYLKEANMNILLVEPEVIGGQIIYTSKVTNYPGIQNTSGAEIADLLDQQLESLHVLKLEDSFNSFSKINNNFEVSLLSGKYLSKSIIYATGAGPKLLGVENEYKYIGKGISYCALCDGPVCKDKDIFIAGGGNSAISEAIYLSKIARSVTIIQSISSLTCNQQLKDIVNNISNIHILYNATITKVEGEIKLEAIWINNTQYSTNHLFIAIGRSPRSQNIDVKKIDGYIETDEWLQSSIPGLFVAGDVRVKNVRQLITAAADGAIAANGVIRYLQGG